MALPECHVLDCHEDPERTMQVKTDEHPRASIVHYCELHAAAVRNSPAVEVRMDVEHGRDWSQNAPSFDVEKRLVTDGGVSPTVDHYEPLGDASEVYGVEATGEADARAKGPVFRATLRDVEGSLHVDDIFRGNVALLTKVKEDDAEFSTLTQLSPSQSRSLGQALIRAAAYAEDQRGESS